MKIVPGYASLPARRLTKRTLSWQLVFSVSRRAGSDAYPGVFGGSMSRKTKNLWLTLPLIAAANLCLIGATTVCAQDEDARRLWDGAFLKKRAEAKTPSSTRKTTAYRRVTPRKTAGQNPTSPSSASQNQASQNPAASNQPDVKADGEMIGLTIWRLRATRAADNQEARLLLEDESSKETEWTLERVEVDIMFAAGDLVRLGIESPRDGYLYVVDREQYADGTASDPYLIFPLLRNRGGANSVAACQLIKWDVRSEFWS